MIENEKKISNNLKQYRKAEKLSQQDLADQVGVTRQSILLIEKDKFNPSILLALKIANALGVDVNDLFFLE
ncbi:helix-turn-helix transcriptional regulator [Companilactobacillus sp.]|jgi:putative transcriptional regulator|uniref:helix-turn-helix transcriptional regulator n=1 Tax=Companilactobacillus sp. TaxID=2767905 RepID=UPI0025BA4245|nr:helix-turn-helix transcriptional regulator [Companilactobacillus sp.]MCH4009059.1 helix-turn-helix transcriptional regulator [Companilactobacillus sp.]MCH4050762.1 helix-turn-helix transcriptional regulator [Companilactobacillus sp.]MCH4077001.1 helix-turn-helix transcriptional regulator [Companilactobacillus sp.]MCH4125577.1 helix-turn-helix transcriptional regulator [Companilactobacillus sp.]MCI1311286.1 helix-turn-helix transcriptional regulator [Companilactobacillus sp.]